MTGRRQRPRDLPPPRRRVPRDRRPAEPWRASAGIAETRSSYGPACPRCGYVQPPDHADYYDERKYRADVCERCEQPFDVRVRIHVCWTCWNGEKSDG